MPTPTLDTRPDGALVVAADTAEEALTHIGARLGDDAEILDARKVQRGGWKGFFATEVVELTARAREAAPAGRTGSDGSTGTHTPARDVAAEDRSGPGGVAAALAAMTEQADDREQEFRRVLTAQLEMEPTREQRLREVLTAAVATSTSTPLQPTPAQQRSQHRGRGRQLAAGAGAGVGTRPGGNADPLPAGHRPDRRPRGPGARDAAERCGQLRRTTPRRRWGRVGRR